jgi:hypothetical protein
MILLQQVVPAPAELYPRDLMADKNVAPPTANAPVKKSRKRHIAHKKLHEAFALITRILRRLFSAAKLFENIALLTILGRREEPGRSGA